VLVAEGELDAYSAPELADRFAEVTRASAVVVDLAGVSFMDSTALGLLVRSLRELEEGRVATRIVLPETPARRIFEITTLDQVLPVAASRGEALAELA
jgi:anti-anti-sigma factor